MASPPIKEAAVVVVDLGAGLRTLGPQTHDELRSCVSEQLWRSFLYGGQNEMGLLLAGTDGTHNTLHARHPSEYKHLTVAKDVGHVTADDVKGMAGRVQVQGGRVDLVEALILAGDMLHARIQDKYRFRQRIFIYTGAFDECERKDDLVRVLDSFAAKDIRVDVVGVDFCFRTAEEARRREDWDALTVKQQNEKVLRHVVETLQSHVEPPSTKGHYGLCTASSVMMLDEAVGYLRAETKKAVRMTTLATVTLDLGDADSDGCLRIPLKMYTKTMKATGATMVKASKKARLEAGENFGETSEVYKVETERRYHHADDPDKETDKDDVVKAYRYGNTAVPFNEIDERMLEFDGGLKSLRVLAFVPRRSVKRQHLDGPVQCAYTPQHDPGADAAFFPLVEALYEMDMCAVVRAVRRDAATPRVSLAWPHVTSRKKVLLLSTLPFAEDLRRYEFAPFPDSTAPKPEQLAAMERVVDSMDLMDIGRAAGGAAKRTAAQAAADDPVAEEDEEEEEEGADHRLLFNPALQFVAQCLKARVVKPQAEIPEPEQRIAASSLGFEREGNALHPFLSAATGAVEDLNKALGVRVNPDSTRNKEKGSKAFWFKGGGGGGGGTAAPDLSKLPPLPHFSEGGDGGTRRGGGGGGGGGGSTSALQKQPSIVSSLSGAGGSGGSRRQQQQQQQPGSLGLLGPDGASPSLGAAGGGGGAQAARVTTISPVDDFHQMLQRRDGDYARAAFDGIKTVARQLVVDSVGEQFYAKAVACVAALRAGAVREDEPEEFNGFLRDLKSTFSAGKKRAFWRLVQAARITLVSREECAASTVTEVDAACFPDTETAVLTPVCAVADDEKEEDLFGDLS